jgi:hypothetical protein
MPTSKRIINLSMGSNNTYAFESRGLKKKSFGKIFFFIILILLISFFIAKIFFGFSFRSIIITLNEMEIRYDTFSLSFAEEIPVDLKADIQNELEKVEHEGKKRFSFVEEDGDIEIALVDGENFFIQDYLIPVGHLYWIENAFEKNDILQREIVVNEGRGKFVEAVLQNYLDDDIEIVEKSNILSYLENNESDALGIVSFSELNNQFQIVNFEGKYFLDDKEGGIPFKIGVDINSAPRFLADVVKNNVENIYEATPELENIAKINMSGVTAISRNLAVKIERSGDNAYPAQLIGEFLGNADIVHTSNEVSFVPGCSPESSMRFCSHPKYIETLEKSGINVIELTGNHNNDFGSQYNADTIEMYKERGWDYYGGGLNTEDAAEILYKEVKDSKIAFLGYNYYDTIYNYVTNLAGENRAGANSFSFEKMESDIAEAKEQGAQVIVTFQFQECYSYPPSDVIYPICYKPLSSPDQKAVFRRAIDYGADIVVGSQAHQPQTYEIYNGKTIFYGTGNLFFDQIQWIGTRQGMILTHYVYKNEILQSRISTTLYGDDMRPYVSTGEDRDLLLRLLKEARD